MNERVFNQAVEKLRSAERIERLEVEKVAELTLKGLNVHSLLDVGTGSALFAEAFYKKKIKVAGIDINPEMIDAARKFLPGADFRLATAEEIPFGDNSFDIVFMGLVLHEVDDLLRTLKEAFRVAVVGLSVLEWDYKEQEIGPPLEHRLKRETLDILSKEAGFRIFEVTELNKLVLYRFLKYDYSIR